MLYHPSRFTIAIALGISSLLSLSPQVQASSVHYQIDLKTHLIANEQGEFSAIDMLWTYDREVSDLLLTGEDMSGSNQDTVLRERSQAIIEDLYAYGFYTELAVDGEPVPFGTVINNGMIYTPTQNLKLSFRLNLKQPIALKGKQLSLRLSDPDGSANLAYTGVRQINLDASLRANCQLPTLHESIQPLPNGHTPLVQTLQLDCR